MFLSPKVSISYGEIKAGYYNLRFAFHFLLCFTRLHCKHLTTKPLYNTCNSVYSITICPVFDDFLYSGHLFPLQCMCVESRGKITRKEHEIVGASDLGTRRQDSTRLVPPPRERTEFGWSKILFQVNGINLLDLKARTSWCHRRFENSAVGVLGSTILAAMWLVFCYVVTVSMLFARHEYNDIRKRSVFSLCRFVHVVVILRQHVHTANTTT